jgi:hypothetical protein
MRYVKVPSIGVDIIDRHLRCKKSPRAFDYLHPTVADYMNYSKSMRVVMAREQAGRTQNLGIVN